MLYRTLQPQRSAPVVSTPASLAEAESAANVTELRAPKATFKSTGKSAATSKDSSNPKAKQQPSRFATVRVEVTAYTSSVAETDSTPNVTASGTVPGPGTLAVSRDLLGRFPYGSDVVFVSVGGENCGGWVPEAPMRVADTMNARLKNHMDIWLETPEEARNWGRCEADVRFAS